MSSVMNFEDNILAAIQTIVNDAVEHASYDRTIQATIKKVVDATTGKYRIMYQDSAFYAYATSTDVTYTEGTNVYVLIPGNDMSRTKTILGTVDNLGVDFINILTNEETYENLGVNIVNNSNEFSLNSYKTEQLIKLYDRDDEINRIGLNVDDAEMYLKQNDYFTLGAYFKTNLPNQQKAKGNYGISFDFVYEDEQGEEKHQIYTIDIDSFNGNPYNLYNYTKQTSTYENFDKDKFKYIDSISIFESGFPYERSGEPDDIFVNNIQIFGARKITEEELASCMLSILTPQGTYFKATDVNSSVKNLKAQIRVKGKIASDYSNTRFYWFRENAAVTKNTNADLYCSFGGSGWECLNESNVTGENTKEWVPADENFQVKKSDLLLKENKYKCVALYNDGEIVLSREILLYNLGAAEMSITSSNGQQFYFDMGETDLTCTLSQTLPNLTYSWGKVDLYGNFTAIDSETNTINVQAKDISRFGIYKCAVYSGENYVGTASIVLYNSFDKTENAQIIINNSSQVFKYNENGIAPNNASLEKPITILPLSFTLFDDDGAEIAQGKIAAAAIEWMVPVENTMLSIPDGYGIPTIENGWAIYRNLRTLNFNILARYDANKENNTIKLKVTLGDRVYTSETNLIFLKEGERGSNGTDFVCKVIPNSGDANFINQPIVTVYNNTYSLNYTPAQQNHWFKVQLWHDGELIYEGTEDGTSTEEKTIDVSWSVLRNSYSNTIKDDSNLTINENTGVVTFNTTEYNAPANIVQCKVSYDGVEYYDNIPVIVKFLNDNVYDINIKENSGFRYAIYESDGRNPKYDNSTPFEIITTQDNNDISLNDSISYTWAVLGQYYENSIWEDIENLIPITSYIETHDLTKNQKRYKPIDSYDGLCVNNTIACYVENGNSPIGIIYIPIDLYINRYGNAALNNWNGNSIQIRKEDGLILSPQIGAGKKETDDNTFTGMFMGDVEENATTERETGLFGYYHGQRTIELNAETGTAKFGKNGAGQIIMDPTANRAVIRSGKYSEANNTGLEIDLTDPHIKFGDGSKFQVDNQGNVTATALTITPSQVNGLNDALDDIEDLKDTINYFEVSLNTESIVVPCSAIEKKPLATASYTIDAMGYFKGQPIIISNIITSDTYTGISCNPNVSAQTIVFSVDSATAITNLINEYNFTFTYTNNGQTYTVEKQINVVLTQQGQDGEQGPVGPAGKDGTSITVKGSYDTLVELLAAHPSGNTLGDAYIVGLDLYVYTNKGEGSGSQANDWNNVGQFKGQDARRCFIVASTEVFKSTDGGSTYAPDTAVLTPYFQAVEYQNWAYSTTGGINFVTINNQTSISGITIDEDARLTLAKNCELFDTNSTLVFKCSTDYADVYDTITIARIVDGESASSAFISNPSLSFSGAANTGEVAATSIITNIIGYQGSNKVACSLGTPTGDIPTGMNVTIGDTINNERPVTITITDKATLGGKGNQKGIITIPVYTPIQTTLQLNWIKINEGTAGYNSAQVYLYQRAERTPSNISYSGNLTYTFSTHKLSSTPTGWSQTMPATNGQPLYMVSAVAYSNTTTDTIAASEWTAPIKLVEDGLNGASSQLINITTTTQTFKRTSSSTAYTPERIVLIPETQNCEVGTWSYYNTSNSTWTNITSTSSSTTAAYLIGDTLCVPRGVNYNNNATAISFKCTSSEGECSDVITIVKLSDGDPGTSPYISYLTNETQAFAYGTEKTATTNLYAYQGTTEKTVTIKTVNGKTAATTDTATGLTGMNFRVSSTSAVNHPTITFTSTASLPQSATERMAIVYRITGESTDRTIYFSYSTTTRGATGAAARVYELNASANAIVKKVDDTFSPTSITFTSYYRDGTGTSKTAYSGTWWIQSSIDGNTWTNMVAASATNATSKTVSPSGDMKLIRAYLGPAGTAPTATNALDVMTIPILNDSKDIEIGGRNLLLAPGGTNVTRNYGSTLEETEYTFTGWDNYGYKYLADDKINWDDHVGEYLCYRCYMKNVEQTTGTGTGIMLHVRTDATSGTTYRQYGGGKNGKLDSYLANGEEGWLQLIIQIPSAASINSAATTITHIEASIRHNSYTGAGTVTVKENKVEFGNVPTAWTPAPEDSDDNLSSVIMQYTMTDNENAPSSSAQWDTSYTAAGTKYIWQRMVSYSQTGDLIIESTPSLIYIPTRALVSSTPQYYIHTSRSNAPTATADSSWLTEKPIWVASYKNSKYLWIRTKNTYTIGDPDYTAPALDESWETYSALDTSVMSLQKSINDAIDNGVVEIKNGMITVYNDAAGENASTAAVRINQKGIIFMYKENGAWVSETATWGFDKNTNQWTFNSELINVISLKADQITNGKLTLKGTDLTLLGSYSTLTRLKSAHSTGSVGQAYYVEDEQAIYTWNGSTWEKRDGGEFLLQDINGGSVCTIDANGLNILCKDGSRFAVKVQEDENGRYNLHIYDSHNSLLAYADTENNIWVMTNAKVDVSLQIGLKVKIVPIGNGIGFIAA